jgi:large subunit ribosomal protein L24
MARFHIRRGDTVEVIAGSNKGPKDKPTRGKVLRLLTDKGRVVVEHVNMVKKHQRPTQKLRQGGIIEREAALALSNVLLVCGRCDKPTRTGIKVLGDGRKARVCKRCGESVDKG